MKIYNLFIARQTLFIFIRCLDAERLVGGTNLHKISSTITASVSLHPDLPLTGESLGDTKTEINEENLGTKPKHTATDNVRGGIWLIVGSSQICCI